MPSHQRPLNVAVIGAGTFGELHAQTMAALPEAHLAAVVDTDSERAAAVATRLDVKHTFTDIVELIAACTVDAAIVATPTTTHVDIALEALRAGLNVLVEKPVGIDGPDIQRLANAAEDCNATVMAGHICLFHSQLSPLIARVRERGFRVLHFARHRSTDHVERFPDEHPINLTTVHDLYIAAQMAIGEEPQMFDALDAAGGAGRPDCSWSTLRWGDGRVATFHAHWTLPVDAKTTAGFDYVEVHGDGYSARLNTNPQDLSWYEEKMNRPFALDISVIHGRPVGMLAEELRTFIAACRGAPVPPGCRIADAVQLQQWMDRLIASAKTKRDT